MRRRHLLAGAAGLAAAPLALPALAQGARAHTLRFIPQADVTSIDPLSTTSYAVRNHAHLVFDTLYGIGTDGVPQPQLAEGHTVSDDGLRWTFTLRDGPLFHDGEKVRAVDAVASIKRWLPRDTHGQTLATRIDEIRVLDDRRFEIRLNRRFGALLGALAKSSSYPAFILPERFANTPPTTPITEIVGSGPYRFIEAERRSGALVVYQRFDRYSPTPVGTASLTAGPKLALFERVEWHIISDPATAAAALQAGEVDFYERIAPDLQAVLERHRDVVVDRIETNGTIAMLRPNHLHPPFDDPAVRRAVLPALNQADFMQAILGDDRRRWRDGVGVFPHGSPLASDAGLEALTSPRSLEKARAALAATGKAGAKTIVLLPGDQVNNSALTQVAIDLFRKIGLDAQDATSDWGTMLQRRGNRNPPDQGGWNAVVVLFGGDDLVNPGGHPLLRANGKDAWFGWPASERLEQLRDAWFDATALPAQQEIGRQIQAAFFEDLPFWPLGQYYVAAGYRKGLKIGRRGLSVPLNISRET